MKTIFCAARGSWSGVRVLCLLSLVVSLLSLSGCIRLSGTAGYSKMKDDEIVSKSAGFDVDTARLVPNNAGVS